MQNSPILTSITRIQFQIAEPSDEECCGNEIYRNPIYGDDISVDDLSESGDDICGDEIYGNKISANEESEVRGEWEHANFVLPSYIQYNSNTSHLAQSYSLCYIYDTTID